MVSSVPAMYVDLSNVYRVCWLGLATRGNSKLTEDAVFEAIDQGISYLKWCGHPDGLRDERRR